MIVDLTKTTAELAIEKCVKNEGIASQVRRELAEETFVHNVSMLMMANENETQIFTTDMVWVSPFSLDMKNSPTGNLMKVNFFLSSENSTSNGV